MLDVILNMLFTGTLNGAVLTLVALGYSLIYGVGGIMNLSHGAYFMLTGYILLWMLGLPISLNPLLIVVFALTIVTIIGALTYILLVKPLQDSPINVILITFAVAFLVEQLVTFISGNDSKTISELILIDGYTEFLGVSMQYHYILVIVLSLMIVLFFGIFISKSKIGKSIRAVSQDREAATLMGINANRILLYTFIIATFLSATAAFLYLPGDALDGPGMGWRYLTNSFAVVILGGLGSLGGSVLGAFIIGYSSSFTLYFIPNGAAWTHLIPLIIIVVMLIIRPQGLFGKGEH